MRCVESVPFVVPLARFRADACAPRERGPLGFFLRRTVQWTGWSFERHMIARRMHCQFFSSLHPQDVVPTILFSFQRRLASTWRTVQKRPLHHVLCIRSGCSSPLLLFASIRVSRPCSGTRHVRVGRLVLPKLGSSSHVRRGVSRSTCSFPIQIPQRSLTDLLSSSELRFHAFCDAFVALDALPRRPSASHVAQQHVEASLSFVFLWFRWAPGTDRRGFQSTVRFERKENRTSVRDKRGILPLRTWGQEPPREVLQGRRSWGWRASREVDSTIGWKDASRCRCLGVRGGNLHHRGWNTGREKLEVVPNWLCKGSLQAPEERSRAMWNVVENRGAVLPQQTWKKIGMPMQEWICQVQCPALAITA